MVTWGIVSCCHKHRVLGGRANVGVVQVMTLQGIVETCKFRFDKHEIQLTWFYTDLTASDEHLIVTRVLLGLFESGFFPAASYLLFTWYCRYEVQTRMGTLFCLTLRISESRNDFRGQRCALEE
jgi:MFS family permease